MSGVLSARAWDPNELPPGFTVEKAGAPVKLEGKTLFRVRVNAKTQTAAERAEKFSEVILQLAQDPLFKPSTITVKDFGLSSDIMAGDKVIVPVWTFEAKLEGRPAEELARDYAEKIRQAIAAYQKEHSLSNLIRGIAKTILAFLILVALIFLINRGVRRLNRSILATEKIHSVKFGEIEFFNADRIKAMVIHAVKDSTVSPYPVPGLRLPASGSELLSGHPAACPEILSQPVKCLQHYRRRHLGSDPLPGVSGGLVCYRPLLLKILKIFL